MKKVLALTLSVILIVALFPMLSVGAAWQGLHSTILGFSDNDPMLNDKEVGDFGQIVLGADEIIMRIFIRYENFTFKDDSISKDEKAKQVTEQVMDTMKLEFKYPGQNDWSYYPDPKFFKAGINRVEYSASNPEPHFTLTPEGIGKVDMDIRLVFIDPATQQRIGESEPIHMHGVFLDPTINKHIIGITDKSLGDAPGTTVNPKQITLNGSQIKPSELENLNIQPGDIIRFDIDTDNFTWEPDILEMATKVRKSSLDNDKVTLIKKVMAGKDIVESVAFENVDGRAMAVVRFIENFDNVKDRDFDFQIAMAQHGVRHDPSSVTLKGTFGNPVYEVADDFDYVYIGDGVIAKATKNVRGITLDMGKGVIATMNMYNGQRCHGYATQELDEDARAVMNYFPEIRKTIRVKANFDSRVQHITLEDQETNYFVYDADGHLLGRSADKLEFRDRYYLSTKEIDFADDIDLMAPAEELQVEDISENPPTGSSNLGLGALNVLGLAVLAVGAFALSNRYKEQDDNEPKH